MYIGNLPHKATKYSVSKLFGHKVKSVVLIDKQKTSTVYGFVDFNSIKSLDAAIGKFWELDGCQLTVEKATKLPGTFFQTYFAQTHNTELITKISS